MKIVVWKSPKYLSKLLAKLFGVEGKEDEIKDGAIKHNRK